MENEDYSKDLTTQTASVVAIPPGSSMTAMFKPCCGWFNTIRRYLPLQIMPIVIELSLVDNPLDPIIYTGVNRGVAAVESSPFLLKQHQIYGQLSMSKPSATLLHLIVHLKKTFIDH